MRKPRQRFPLSFTRKPKDQELFDLIQALPPGERNEVLKDILLPALRRKFKDSPSSLSNTLPLTRITKEDTPHSSVPTQLDEMQGFLDSHL